MIDVKSKEKIIYCKCIHCNMFDKQNTEIIESDLSKTNAILIETDDLCEAIIKKNSILFKTLTSKGTTTIIACHKRAVLGLLKSAGMETEQDKIFVINRHDTKADVPNKKIFPVSDHPRKSDPIHIKGSKTWVAWFPVIDLNRCTHCKQCMSFCLFKVFDLDENGKVFVKNPENCKNNCPACARICPEIAIIFPKLTESPINGEIVSDNPTGEDGNKNLRIDMNAMRDGDMMSALKTRNAKNRTTLLKRKNIEKALEERKKCGCENIGPFNVINKN